MRVTFGAVILLLVAMPVVSVSQDTANPVITPENAARVTELATLAWGRIWDATWIDAPLGEELVTVGAAGILRYRPDDLSAPFDRQYHSSARPSAVAASADGLYRAIGYEDGGVVLLYGVAQFPESLEGMGTWVRDIAFSPDGRYLAAAADNGMVFIWEVESRRLLHQLAAHAPNAMAVAFHPDGRTLATGGGNYRQFGGIQAPEVVKPFGADSFLRAVQPDPEVSDLVRLWDVETGERITELTGTTYAVENLAYSSDGALLAAGGLNVQIVVWDAETQRVIRKHDTPSSILDLIFTPDDNRILYSTPSTNRGGNEQPPGLYEWNVLDDRVRRVVIRQWRWSGIGRLAYNRDRTMLAAVSGNEVTLHDAVSYRQTAEMPQHHFHLGTGSPYASPAFSPDGRSLAMYDYITSEIVIWDVEARQERLRIDASDHILITFAFHPDNVHLASSAYGGEIRVWDTGTGQQVATLTGHEGVATMLTFSPDGKWLASASSSRNTSYRSDYSVRLWDWEAQSGYLVTRFQADDIFFLVSALTFSPGGDVLIVRDNTFTVGLFDTATGEAVSLADVINRPAVLGIEVSLPDDLAFERELYLAGLSERKRTDGNLESDFPRALPTPQVRLTGEGYLYAHLQTMTEDDTVAIVDLEDNRALRVLIGHRGEIRDTSFSPDGRLIISAAGSSLGRDHDNTLRLWNTATGEQLNLLYLSPTGDGLYTLVVSPDGRYIVTGTSHGVIRLWGIE